MISSLILLTLSAIFIDYRFEIVALMSNSDIEIQEQASKVLLIIGFVFVFDGLQLVAQGSICALGLQKQASVVSFISNWFVGVPIAIYMTFYQQLSL